MSDDHIIRAVDITALSQRLKSDRNFLKWMTRRYREINPEQGEAFSSAAEMVDKLRSEILAGDFDSSKELFTPELDETPAAEILDLQQQTSSSDGFIVINEGGYYCPEPECLRQRGHTGPHESL